MTTGAGEYWTFIKANDQGALETTTDTIQPIRATAVRLKYTGGTKIQDGWFRATEFSFQDSSGADVPIVSATTNDWSTSWRSSPDAPGLYDRDFTWINHKAAHFTDWAKLEFASCSEIAMLQFDQYANGYAQDAWQWEYNDCEHPFPAGIGSFDPPVESLETGDVDDCKAACTSQVSPWTCRAFVHVTSGSSHAGKCLFIRSPVSIPDAYSGDTRTCYIRGKEGGGGEGGGHGARSCCYGGGGAAYGGAGGDSDEVAGSTFTYGSENLSSLVGGSGGGGGGGHNGACQGQGGGGGGAVGLKAGSWVVLTGAARVSANGADGTGKRAGGGGSGGAIRVEAENGIAVGSSARLEAKGGESIATHNAGGDGGGGRIALISPRIIREDNSASVDVGGHAEGTVFTGLGWTSIGFYLGLCVLVALF